MSPPVLPGLQIQVVWKQLWKNPTGSLSATSGEPKSLGKPSLEREPGSSQLMGN